MPRPALAAEPVRTWIVGATVLSPERGDEGQRLNVLIEGERIAAVTPTLPADAARTAQIVEAGGQVLIPGLIDSHVHLASVPGFNPVMAFTHPLITRDYRAQMPRSFLRYGYTTLVDLVPTSRDVLDDFMAAPAHPDLLHCGALPLWGGYPSHYAPWLLRGWVFPNAVAPSEPGSKRSPQAAVARAQAEGARCVKTFFERGFGPDRNLPVPDAALFGQIVQAARAAGMPVLLHASSVEAQRFGVAGGADILVHGLWNWQPDGASGTLPAPARELLDQIAERRIGFMPTLQVLGGLSLLFEPGYLDRPELRRVLPASLLEWLRSPAGQWFKNELAGGQPDAVMRGRFDAALRRGAEATRYLAQPARGARFLFGSDTPSGPTPGNLPGLNGYLEMQRLAAAGLSLRQIFEAATLHNAQAFGLAAQVGSIEVGKRANLLLLASSPLLSVQAYDQIQSVWIGGRRLAPSSLEAQP
ncbi:amidohydrolase family protein [Aquabacterium sp. OR-4]|uniref:amidohydrolase family protein n=1 Tax=Aquabacterium sp. OR-4 TaxID=2978127 RepID=UPI0021B348F2|nr:amidohydrolase family protein [Aquabacterium sp. OR-4]MDT7838239.1 amidohydrolase family protein [Aquabacterium sp. OR-4]